MEHSTAAAATWVAGRRNDERQRGRSKGGRPSSLRLIRWGSRRGARPPRSPGARAGREGRGGGMAGCVRPENTALPKLLGGPATSRAGFKLSRWEVEKEPENQGVRRRTGPDWGEGGWKGRKTVRPRESATRPNSLVPWEVGSGKSARWDALQRPFYFSVTQLGTMRPKVSAEEPFDPDVRRQRKGRSQGAEGRMKRSGSRGVRGGWSRTRGNEGDGGGTRQT